MLPVHTGSLVVQDVHAWPRHTRGAARACPALPHLWCSRCTPGPATHIHICVLPAHRRDGGIRARCPRRARAVASQPAADCFCGDSCGHVCGGGVDDRHGWSDCSRRGQHDAAHRELAMVRVESVGCGCSLGMWGVWGVAGALQVV
eukprot:365872-Chlamydomonas_euryale.AAC.6